MDVRGDTREDYAKLTRTLEFIRENPARDEGICVSIYFAGLGTDSTVGELWRRVKLQLFESWPLYSGDPLYPVPGYPTAERAFNECRDYWEGEYGDMRRDLLDFLIQECAARALDPR